MDGAVALETLRIILTLSMVGATMKCWLFPCFVLFHSQKKNDCLSLWNPLIVTIVGLHRDFVFIHRADMRQAIKEIQTDNNMKIVKVKRVIV